MCHLQGKIFLFILMLMGCIVHAGQDNLTELNPSYGFKAALKASGDNSSNSDQSEEVQMALIENNYKYVLTTAGMFVFSLIIITLLMKITPHQAKDLVTIIGLVSVVFGTILLMLVVDTHETLTAPMGILGAIAGYLFGAAHKSDSEMTKG